MRMWTEWCRWQEPDIWEINDWLIWQSIKSMRRQLELMTKEWIVDPKPCTVEDIR